ncbi:MAG: Ig-like domain-containing protein, partial [Acidobacteriota bacterium]
WDRYTDLNQLFSDSWRISDASSLFDYAPGDSTSTYTINGWPIEDATSCELPDMGRVDPVALDVAAEACAGIIDRMDRANCTADVAVTGELEFAATYVTAQKLEQGGTKVDIHPEVKFIDVGKRGTFVAVVKRSLTGQRLAVEKEGEEHEVGAVQFYLNGRPEGDPVKVDRSGRAQWTSAALQEGTHIVSAHFLPSRANTVDLASQSRELHYVVRGDKEPEPF